MPDTQIEATVRGLIRAGSTYDLDALAECYDPALEIVMVPPAGAPMIFDFAANMAFFRNRLESGAAPLDQAVTFLHSTMTGDDGCAVVERRMALTDAATQSIIFTLILRRTDGRWRVTRETAVIRA